MNSYTEESECYLSVINIPESAIHEIAEHESAMKGAMAETTEMYEAMTYTQAERAWGDGVIDDCLLEIYEKSIAYCSSVLREQIETVPHASINFIHPLSFEIQTISIIESKLKKMIAKYILKTWYLKKAMKDFYLNEEAEYNHLFSEVMGLLHRRMTPIRRNMSHFN